MKNKPLEHEMGCAINAAEVADEFAVMGCTCGAEKKLSKPLEHPSPIPPESDKTDWAGMGEPVRGLNNKKHSTGDWGERLTHGLLVENWSPHTVYLFVSELLDKQKRDWENLQRRVIIHQIKTWTKGRNVTKESLRNFLNNLLKLYAMGSY